MEAYMYADKLWVLLALVCFAVEGGFGIHDFKTVWMTYVGCFYGNLQSEMTNIKNETIQNNQPKTCSRLCGNEPYFALQKDSCLCFKDNIKNKLTEIKENRCHEKCLPLNQYYFNCGSQDSYSVYRRDSEFRIEEKEDCLTISIDKIQSTLQAKSCDQKYQSLCKTKQGMIITNEESGFYRAKLRCENNLGRLMIPNETMPRDAVKGRIYWIGTFRQNMSRQTSNGTAAATSRPLNPSNVLISIARTSAAITTSINATISLVLFKRTAVITQETPQFVTNVNRTGTRHDLFGFKDTTIIYLLSLFIAGIIITNVLAFILGRNCCKKSIAHISNVDSSSICANNETRFTEIEVAEINDCNRAESPAEVVIESTVQTYIAPSETMNQYQLLHENRRTYLSLH